MHFPFCYGFDKGFFLSFDFDIADWAQTGTRTRISQLDAMGIKEGITLHGIDNEMEM